MKENAEDIVDRFENKFKEFRIEGKKLIIHHPQYTLKEKTRRFKKCTWVLSWRQERDIDHTAKTDLNLEIKDRDLVREIGMSLGENMKKTDQDTIDSRHLRGEASQTVVINRGHPQDH